MKNINTLPESANKIIIDLDGTLTIDSDLPYDRKIPNKEVIEACRKYKKNGFNIVINTARNMNTYNGDIDLIRANTLPIILKWLKENDVPFDEVLIGKPWCGFAGFYVDDKAIRPDEFVKKSHSEVNKLVGNN